MEFHFGKGSAINNPTVDQLEPEALRYEPQKNGRPRLIGVEFLVPSTLVPRNLDHPTEGVRPDLPPERHLQRAD